MEDTTRCHGTGGSADGERNLSAVVVNAHAQCSTGTIRSGISSQEEREKVGKEARKWERGKKGLEVLALSDVSRVGGHPDDLRYVACGV